MSAPRRETSMRVEPEPSSSLREKTVIPPDETESWRWWFREDFLRACFVGGALAWDGFGAAEIKELLDPYRAGEGLAPWYVYAAIVAFLVVSTFFQVRLYRRWWPPPAGAKKPSAKTSEPGRPFWRRF